MSFHSTINIQRYKYCTAWSRRLPSSPSPKPPHLHPFLHSPLFSSILLVTCANLGQELCVPTPFLSNSHAPPFTHSQHSLLNLIHLIHAPSHNCKLEIPACRQNKLILIGINKRSFCFIKMEWAFWSKLSDLLSYILFSLQYVGF